MNIALDIMGGDYAPEQALLGVHRFLQEHTDPAVHLLLVGSEEAARPFLHVLQPHEGRYTLVSASEEIGMHEHPTKALKEKPDSSIAVGFGALARGKADAFISAGNTGAMLVGALYSVKAIEGILRPTIASPLPRTDGGFNFLLDVGINADCKPEHLLQFAILGSLYVKHVLGKENPTVGLLNIGEEEGKGNILAQAAYPLLKEHDAIHFSGNVEGRDLFGAKADVVVCEGFVGNVALKMAESVYQIFAGERGLKDDFLSHFNYELYGGTPVLGINSPVVIGHGISSARAFSNMIDVACKMVGSGLIDAFRAHFAETTAA
jgi:glycerol-3-phosphate acyltransferase PlsX